MYDKIDSELEDLRILCCSNCKESKKEKDDDCPGCLNELDMMKLNQLNAQTALKCLLNMNSEFNLDEKIVLVSIENMYIFFTKYLDLLQLHDIKRPFQDYNNYEEALKQLLNLINIK